MRRVVTAPLRTQSQDNTMSLGFVVEPPKLPKRYLETQKYCDRSVPISLMYGEEERLIAMRRIAELSEIVGLYGHRNGSLSVFLHHNYTRTPDIAMLRKKWSYGEIIIRRGRRNEWF